MEDRRDDEQRRQRDARGEAVRTVVLVRLIAAPLLTLCALVQPQVNTPWVLLVAAVAVVHVGGTSRLMLTRDPSDALLLGARVGDLLLIAAGIAAADAGSPALALAGLLAVLLSPSLLLPGRARALEAGFAVVVTAMALVDGFSGDDGLQGAATVLLAAILIVAVAGLTGREDRADVRRLSALAAERQALLGETAARTESERRGLSQELHDGVLQTLLAAGQDLDEAVGDGKADDVQRARELVRTSVEALREAVVEMHPSSLTGAALPHALGALVAHHRDRGARIEADIDAEATGVGDEELYAVGRELLANVTGRPKVGVVHVRLWREAGEARLEVVREGGGASPGSREGDTAIATVGIAWTAERLRRAGGGLRLDLGADAPGRGLAWAPLTASPRPSADGDR